MQGIQTPSKEPARPEESHTQRNTMDTSSHARGSHWVLQNELAVVHWQSSSPLVHYYVLKYVKKFWLSQNYFKFICGKKFD